MNKNINLNHSQWNFKHWSKKSWKHTLTSVVDNINKAWRTVTWKP